MIKKLLVLLPFLPLAALAQPSLTASHAPMPNTVFTYHDANVPNPPFTFSKTGTSNTWDFTGITAFSGNEDTTYVVAASSIPHSSSFPSATHAFYSDGDINYTVVRVDASGVYMLGSVGDVAGTGNLIPLVANSPVLAMPFPFTYGSNANATATIELFATGASVNQPSFDSVHFKNVHNSIKDVIAAGTIIVPAGSYPAMLERSVDNTIDTLWVKGASTGNQWVVAPGWPATELDSSFNWYSDQSLMKYAHALYDNSGLHDVVYFKSMVTGINVFEKNVSHAYPNPASDKLYINSGQHMFDILIMDIAGNEVFNGKTTFPLNVSGLNNGTYMIHFKDQSASPVKFIKY